MKLRQPAFVLGAKSHSAAHIPLGESALTDKDNHENDVI